MPIRQCRNGQDCLAENSCKFMSTALEIDSEFAVVLLSQEGGIVDAHPTCHEALGWSREELIGKDIGDLLQSDRELLMTQLLQSKDAEMGIDGQTSFSIRILARRRDETSFPARVVVRRFDQTECCTAAFYRVNPHNDSDTPPVVRPEEIELAMRGNGARSTSQTPAAAKAEKPKSRWRNARLLFGSKPSAEPAPVPAKTTQPLAPPPPRAQSVPVHPAPPTPKPAQAGRTAPVFSSQVPQDIFIRRNAPAPEPEQAPVEAKSAPEAVEPVDESAQLEAAPEYVISESPEIMALPESRPPLVEEISEPGDPSSEKPTYDALVKEVEQEREERRRLEQRASALSSQVSALHLQLSEHLEIETRNQKKVNTLEDQVREWKNQVTQLKSDLQTERQKSDAAIERVEAANTVSEKLTEQLDSLKLVHDALASTQAESEGQLATVSSELKKVQDALAVESMKRHEVELALTAAQQEQAERERKSKLEISKLETALKAKDLELKELASKQAHESLQEKC